MKIVVAIGESNTILAEKDVSAESVDKYHVLYLEKVREIFERHKEEQGYGHRNLVIV